MAVTGGPYSTLLVTDCLGCHSAENTATAIDPVTGAPIVYNTSGPPSYGVANQGLAAGNFYWVAQGDDSAGHNIFAGDPDPVLSDAPGSWIGCGNPLTSCHSNLSEPDITLGPERQGCTKCHMMDNTPITSGYHHADDTDPVVDNETQGWYRYLSGHMSGDARGVSGMEDSDWQFTSSATDHNEYFGTTGNETMPTTGFFNLGHTTTAFCCGCHGNFHQQKINDVWVRHPADAIIQDALEYSTAFNAVAGVGVYDPQVPVARPDFTGWTIPSGDVTLGTDMVMCLSCHKAHGSPYPDMLRWDYSEMIAGDNTKSGGCFSCHTQKND